LCYETDVKTAGDPLEVLRPIPLFKDLDDRELGQVLACLNEFEVHPGHVLVQPKKAGEGLFIIEEGTARVEIPGKRIELGPGEFFGEIALLTEEAVHTGRVSAVTELRGLALRRDDFDTLLENHPKMALSMLRLIAARLAGNP
jgi:CRP-like cAMP-binding protein